MQYHLYADDTTIYMTFEPDDIRGACEKLTKCLSDVKTWMDSMKLKMNGSKTEVIVLSTNRLAQTIGDVPVINVDGVEIQPADVVKLLGVHFDSRLDFDHHVKSLCRTAWFHLRNISRIRKCLSDAACERLIYAFVSSKIDYCNSLLYGLTRSRVSKIQSIQNAAARVLRRIGKREHITPILHDLHWLPVEARCKFKLIMLGHKCIHGTAPKYLSDIVVIRQPLSSLRSAEDPQLLCRRAESRLDARAIDVSIPYLWNSLPATMRSTASMPVFKRLLKTFLFRMHFDVLF